ncbi:IS481 family transposase [Saccharothrix sp. HUAS TT1]|uniref:IS481 family transposase n=1 Tax=unclassified Saccharothrix TaxID=2593673 RepID=UPI00345C52C4
MRGELLVLGIKVAASSVWQILQGAGIDPAPERTTTTWSAFLHTQADALPACDFFETSTLSGTRLYVLAVIEHASRRILGATAHPTASWVTQAARNLVMDLADEGRHVRFLIRDRTLIWNQQHLLHALREYEKFYNTHRPHQGHPQHPTTTRRTTTRTDQAALTHLDIRQRQRLGGILDEYHHAA